MHSRTYPAVAIGNDHSISQYIATLQHVTRSSVYTMQYGSDENFFQKTKCSIGANLHFSRESEFHNLWHARAQELVDFIQDNVSSNRLTASRPAIFGSRWMEYLCTVVLFLSYHVNKGLLL